MCIDLNMCHRMHYENNRLVDGRRNNNKSHIKCGHRAFIEHRTMMNNWMSTMKLNINYEQIWIWMNNKNNNRWIIDLDFCARCPMPGWTTTSDRKISIKCKRKSCPALDRLITVVHSGKKDFFDTFGPSPCTALAIALSFFFSAIVLMHMNCVLELGEMKSKIMIIIFGSIMWFRFGIWYSEICMWGH